MLPAGAARFAKLRMTDRTRTACPLACSSACRLHTVAASGARAASASARHGWRAARSVLEALQVLVGMIDTLTHCVLCLHRLARTCFAPIKRRDARAVPFGACGNSVLLFPSCEPATPMCHPLADAPVPWQASLQPR